MLANPMSIPRLSPSQIATPSPFGPFGPYPNVDVGPQPAQTSGGGIASLLGGAIGGLGDLSGGFDPMSFLSMMGGGEPDAPAATMPGMAIAPSQVRPIILSP